MATEGDKRPRGMPHESAFANTVLCVNCLRPGAAEVPVGHEFGSQSDPDRTSHRLCEPCVEALLNGWFDNLGERHTDQRTVSRADLAAGGVSGGGGEA